MRAISTAGFERPSPGSVGTLPTLQWLNITDLVVDTGYKRPIGGNGRCHVERIAASFNWSCFAPVVVAPAADGKFSIIDGQHRTTAAALVGFDSVPCQIVNAAREEQAAAFKAINRTVNAGSRMALHAASLARSDPLAVQLADICDRAQVELLRYPVPVDRQSAGQTMAVGAITQCLKRYGEETLITALQCVTQTPNNRPGVLSARMIKALCKALDGDHERRDGGLALLEAFDRIDLLALEKAASTDAAARRVNPVQALTDRLGVELEQHFKCNIVVKAVMPTADMAASQGRGFDASGAEQRGSENRRGGGKAVG